MNLDQLDQLECEVQRLPEGTHKTLLEYEIKNIRLDLRNIEACMPKLKHEGHGKIYQVRVTHDPKTFRRLEKPRVFNWPSMEEAEGQALKLMQAGLKTRHCRIHVLEASQ